MSISDPLSLTEAKRLAGNADTVLLRATRDADLETPIGAFLRLDDGGPAYLLESVEGGERLGRYSFLGIGPRRLLEVRGDRATIQARPLSVDRFQPDLPVETLESVDPLSTLRAFLPRRRGLPL
jgi:anthranilate synthase component I